MLKDFFSLSQILLSFFHNNSLFDKYWKAFFLQSSEELLPFSHTWFMPCRNPRIRRLYETYVKIDKNFKDRTSAYAAKVGHKPYYIVKS